jgi:hypothetical protein
VVKKKSGVYLYCFSPLVMLVTFLIEACSAAFLLFRYRLDMSAKLITSMLSFLALFQLAEYMVCDKALVISSLDWARVGYVAITILPPIGIHLGLTIAQKKNPHLLKAAYGSALIFMVFFLFVGHGLQSQACLGNYIIFRTAPYAVLPYTVYYYGWLIFGARMFLQFREQIKHIERKQALKWLAIGYMTFMVPTTVVNIINPASIAGIPSIMCGFAVMMALCLIFKVAPLILSDTNKLQRSESRY